MNDLLRLAVGELLIGLEVAVVSMDSAAIGRTEIVEQC